MATRKTHCQRGHELAGDNLLIRGRGNRACRTCKKASDQRCGAKSRARAKEGNAAADFPRVSEKRCPGCQQVRPADAFNRNSNRLDGLQALCKECHLLADRRYRNRTRDRNVIAAAPEIDQKVCSRCRKAQPSGNFNVSLTAADGLQPNCRICQSHLRDTYYYDGGGKTRAQAYYETNKEALLSDQQVRYRANRDRHIASYRQRKYGVSPETVDAMLYEQKHACKICRQVIVNRPLDPRMLHVDHCHKTNKVRGLLCRSCNHMLGHAKDDAAVLAAGIAYLASVEWAELEVRISPK